MSVRGGLYRVANTRGDFFINSIYKWYKQDYRKVQYMHGLLEVKYSVTVPVLQGALTLQSKADRKGWIMQSLQM